MVFLAAVDGFQLGALANMKKLLVGMTLAAALAGSAHASVSIAVFNATQWGAGDATIGVAGYRIENFEDQTLAAGLQIARSGGAAGNFSATSTLPSTSVFAGLTDDPEFYLGNPLLAFDQGAWDGTHGLINHPGPSFAAPPSTWYGDSGNWGDLTFLFSGGVTSVGFSLDQVDARPDRILINGTLVVGDLGTLVLGGSAASCGS